MLFFNSMLSAYSELTNILPWLYVSVIGILVLSLSSYRKIIEVLETQMTQKLLLEKYEMELSLSPPYLNTKNAVCQKQGVTFLANFDFQKIYLSDFGKHQRGHRCSAKRRFTLAM